MRLVNRLLLAVLASPLHRLLGRSLVGLRLRGTVSGRSIVLPVMQASDSSGLVVLPGHPERKRWWRNLRRPAAVAVLAGGRWRAGTGQVLRPADPGYRAALATYRARWPRTPDPGGGPVVLVTLDAPGP